MRPNHQWSVDKEHKQDMPTGMMIQLKLKELVVSTHITLNKISIWVEMISKDLIKDILYSNHSRKLTAESVFVFHILLPSSSNFF